jgi:heme exporter protein C
MVKALLGRLGWALGFVLPIAALWMVFMVVPNERTMGEVQRIFYFHVASAMTAFTSFFFVLIGGIGFLATGKKIWDRIALATAELGVVFITIVLITGPLWARPVWGHYWVWQDARLVTSLVLWIYFLVYLFLRRGWSDDPQGLRFAAIIGIVGFLDVPLIYFSVRWWNYIHPSHVMGPMGDGLDPTMAVGLRVSMAATMAIWAALLVQRLRLERTRERARMLARGLAREGA